ncbi:zinc uptake regulator, Fur family [Thermoanaerobacter thermohydrosulfuricus]|mgnify:FL=1|uniref:Ferric uptake regulator, Fur family n=6 Tax=Thermoanaerobacter TaxID=1754 RepID=B0KCU7_THEP3|nr:MULTISPECIES: Fur family transcriptional regulator [Thermoanaerobacter]EGD52108.1 ferric uptake regulator, Fur family [Thermoanaerobacter ethanolicus JW 200]EIV99239.1 LOW QUALITY PROTEIN: Fe2+/Zn2+ uptake regulation protein [Thermoanaerobacter siderophilus SR4]ABY95554.1 ferric uptake regulator, Fur family [Thermoanaerobacter pseudethanolicus ATCC 33223]ADV80489.1 ferric-uptake regulator [Thermoanaerobacter brockii subsp. finnii Ako-1]AEM77899.1 ferric uptake regulator, Fur family [Thermoa
MHKQEAIKKLKEHNYKLTPQRELILDIMLNQQGYLSVRQIYEKVKEVFPQVSIDTVYRNLSLLKDINILNETTIGNNIMYVMRKEIHSHTMRCLKCGKIFELDICPLELWINQIKDFEIVDHKIEIVGYCKDCRSNKN